MGRKSSIGLFTGGYSDERGVALKSAATIEKYLSADRYEVHLIDLGRDAWSLEGGGKFDLNAGHLIKGGEWIPLDAAYVMIHGTPAENGLLQGYLDMIGLPYTCSSVFSSALTFDKQATKDYLRTFGVPMAPSVELRVGDAIPYQKLESWGYPLFVKPNKQGSSFGVSKVKSPEELPEAVEKAFQFDSEVLIEQYIAGRELSCGLVGLEEGVRPLPLTEIRSHNEFFDYAAKYERESEEITPADFPDHLTEECMAMSADIYRWLQCSGMVRMDYIFSEGQFFFLEANTIPGMSETSIIPQQAIAAGYTLGDFVELPLLECMRGGK